MVLIVLVESSIYTKQMSIENNPCQSAIRLSKINSDTYVKILDYLIASIGRALLATCRTTNWNVARLGKTALYSIA